jgi:hypothetical protein
VALAGGLAALAALGAYWFVVEYRPGEAHYRLRPTSWWDRELTHSREEAERLRPLQVSEQFDAVARGGAGEGANPSDPWAELREGGAAAVPVLTGLLGSPDRQTRCWAASRLGALGEEARPALPALLGLFRDGDFRVRENALYAAEAVDRDAAARTLAEVLGGEDAGLRRWAASRLAGAGPAAREAVPGLLRLLAEEDRGLREVARDAVRQIDPDALAAYDVGHGAGGGRGRK